jgi:hypothetical protein
MEKPNYYSITPATVRYDKRLTLGARMLYGEITCLTNQKGYCFASNSYFAELYQISTKTVSRWISQLSEYNYVLLDFEYKENSKEVSRRKIYINDTPNINRWTKMSVAGGQKCLEEVDKNVQDNNTSIIIQDKIKEADKPLLQTETTNLYNRFMELYKKRYGCEYVSTSKEFMQLRATVKKLDYDTLLTKLDMYFTNDFWFNKDSRSVGGFIGRINDIIPEDRNIAEPPLTVDTKHLYRIAHYEGMNALTEANQGYSVDGIVSLMSDKIVNAGGNVAEFTEFCKKM